MVNKTTKRNRKRRSDRNHLVYLIRCTNTGEEYIGITVVRGRAFNKSLAIRWRDHLYHAFVEGRNHLLQKAIRKHGEEAFEHEILWIVRGKSAAHEVEREEIGKRKPTLNVECTARKRVGKRGPYKTKKSVG